MSDIKTVSKEAELERDILVVTETVRSEYTQIQIENQILEYKLQQNSIAERMNSLKQEYDFMELKVLELNNLLLKFDGIKLPKIPNVQEV